MSVNKLKGNISHLGTSIGKAGTSIGKAVGDAGANVTYTVKNTVKKRNFDTDDELINQYQHDIKRANKALTYILHQIHRFANVGIPKMFKSHMKSIELFVKLIGANALQFEGIDEYYHVFDTLQKQLEFPLVHPKEMQFDIPALNEQLYNYMVTIDKLTLGTLDDWDIFYQENKLRIIEMQGHLKSCLKLIKKRNQKQDKYESLYKKLDKLMKKTTPLDDKEQVKMTTLEKDLKDVKIVYELLDEKTRTILPHIYVCLEEFIDSLSKILVFKQLDTYKAIYTAINYFIEYYGLLSDKESNANDYQSIIDVWENAMTPVRLQIETFINIIHDKNPELINEEIDDKDKTSSTNKFWNKVSRKMTEKTFKLNPKDHRNGLFNGHLIVDQLDAFIQYYDPNSNVLETYHPTKLIQIDQVNIPVPQILENSAKDLPPLPPRQNTARALSSPNTPRIGLPVSLPLSPIQSIPSSTNFSMDKSQSFESDNESMESESIMSDDDLDNDSDSLTDLSTMTTSKYVSDNSKDRMTRHLSKVYNSSKNKITQAPIHIPPLEFITYPRKSDTFSQTSSVTYKLDEFHKFFSKLNRLEIVNKTLEAKYDFDGVNPGDLSFKKGDKIDIVFEFNTSSPSDGIWLIGVVEGEVNRIGLVPSTYF